MAENEVVTRAPTRRATATYVMWKTRPRSRTPRNSPRREALLALPEQRDSERRDRGHLMFRRRRQLANAGRSLRPTCGAGADWVRRRDLPDVDGWADFDAAPELVHQRLISRLLEGPAAPRWRTRSHFRKTGKGEVRKMAWLNPYDDLYLRILVGRVALAIEAALGPDVFSYRLADDPPGWSTRADRQSFRLRRERARALISEAGCNAIAVADLRHYYPSVEPEVVMDALCQANSPRGAVTLIGELLRDLVPMGAPGGLPIGQEASGLLGNIVLLGLDEAISSRVRGHIRYTDDSWMFLRAETEWAEVREAYTTSASDLGLEVNASKVSVHPKGGEAAEHIIQHGQIAYLTSSAARYRPPQRCADELRQELQRDEPDWVLAKFHLGSLRSAQSPLGLPHPLRATRGCSKKIPLGVGHYLSAVVGSPRNRAGVDRDWLVERATARPTARSLAGQLHLCRVASQFRLGKEHGRRLEEFATDASRRHHVPLQAWAARAWGSSKAHAPGLAIEYAVSLWRLVG